MQSNGVIATVKHFAANNQEYDRHNVSSDVDERTLREIYLPAFEAAVEQGQVGAVMNSYNLLNGVHATENKHLNLDIPERRLEVQWHSDVRLGRDLLGGWPRQSDVAVVAVGFDGPTESEGFDRSFELPFGQDQLIQAVSQANQHTIVTITAAGNVDMHRWLAGVPALLHNWYPGQEGGRALAQIVMGDHSPEGHLPVSFERSWDENPVHDSYYAAPVPKGETPHVNYKEGVFLGYRYYTTYDKQPLFPFGFGLSYTTFSFSNLKVSPEPATPDGDTTVSFDVTNTGHREGATVAQVYVGDPSAKVKRPVKELKGFEKVRLAPGDTRHVSIALNHRSLAYWSDEKSGWEVDPGKFVIYVGDSSEHTPLTQDFQVQ